MARFLTLLALALLTIAEIGAVLWLYDAIGPVGTFAVLGMDMFLGLVLIRVAATSANPTDRGWKVAGGAIIALPGLVLDLVGLAFWLPPTRALFKKVLSRNVAVMASRSGMSVVTVTGPDGQPVTTVVQGDVVPGEVVDPPNAAGAPAATYPPDSGSSGPRVIRGEIVAGPADPPPDA